MTEAKSSQTIHPAEVLEKYGHCVELVPLDSRFENISVALHERDGIYTVWSFSHKPGVDGRLRQIRDQLVALGTHAATPAWAFCGFFAGVSDAGMENSHTQTVIVRESDFTTLTLQFNYSGDPDEFTVVFPVPVRPDI